MACSRHYAEPVARAATPAIAALLAAGVPHEVLRYQHDPRGESFGEEAVEELARTQGVDPAQVFKTLVIALPKGLAVAVLPVPSKLSLKAAAAALGVPKAAMADRAAAERSPATSSAASPRSASASALPTVVDASALDWDRVLCSAGKRGWDVARAPAGPGRAHQRGHRRHPRV